jgi:hypothetical protein
MTTISPPDEAPRWADLKTSDVSWGHFYNAQFKARANHG